jgi:hypothetical protein
MALYLGEDKVKINLNGISYCLNLFSETPITNGIRLLSLESYILKDSNGLYLTAPHTFELLSSDNYILKGSDGLILIIKESG